jgi:hypothetical protein
MEIENVHSFKCLEAMVNTNNSMDKEIKKESPQETKHSMFIRQCL